MAKLRALICLKLASELKHVSATCSALKAISFLSRPSAFPGSSVAIAMACCDETAGGGCLGFADGEVKKSEHWAYVGKGKGAYETVSAAWSKYAERCR